MNESVLTVTAEQAGQRIDKFLSENYKGMSRSAITRLIEDGMALVNGEAVPKSRKLSAGDRISLTIPEPRELDVEPEHIPLDIVYEDSSLRVVNKPKGMVVHPAAGNESGTLVNALLFHCRDSLSGINGVLRPGIVHRIDKDTSGLLMVAKTDPAHRSLAEQIKEHSFMREYLAIVYGNIRDDSGTVDAPIGRHKTDRKRMAVTQQNSREAVTHFEVLERFGDFTLARCRLETGRTHQIRVHMAHIGHPVAGDPVYGPKKVITSLEGQALHAYKLGFVHPESGEYMEFCSDPPEVFTKFLSRLRAKSDIY